MMVCELCCTTEMSNACEDTTCKMIYIQNGYEHDKVEITLMNLHICDIGIVIKTRP